LRSMYSFVRRNGMPSRVMHRNLFSLHRAHALPLPGSLRGRRSHSSMPTSRHGLQTIASSTGIGADVGIVRFVVLNSGATRSTNPKVSWSLARPSGVFRSDMAKSKRCLPPTTIHRPINSFLRTKKARNQVGDKGRNVLLLTMSTLPQTITNDHGSDDDEVQCLIDCQNVSYFPPILVLSYSTSKIRDPPARG
jgi:hypothetical protein